MMKKLIPIIAFLPLLVGCGEDKKTEKEDDPETTESAAIDTDKIIAEEPEITVETDEVLDEIEEISEAQSDVDVEDLILQGMLSDLQVNQRAIMFSEFPNTEVDIKYFPFRPSGLAKSDFFLVQLTYKTGDYEEKEDFGVIYSSLEDGSYGPNQYRLIEGDNRACDVCDILNVEMVDLGGHEAPKTFFEYRSNGEKLERLLNCDLSEMTFYWSKSAG